MQSLQSPVKYSQTPGFFYESFQYCATTVSRRRMWHPVSHSFPNQKLSETPEKPLEFFLETGSFWHLSVKSLLCETKMLAPEKWAAPETPEKVKPKNIRRASFLFYRYCDAVTNGLRHFLVILFYSLPKFLQQTIQQLQLWRVLSLC